MFVETPFDFVGFSGTFIIDKNIYKEEDSQVRINFDIESCV